MFDLFSWDDLLTWYAWPFAILFAIVFFPFSAIWSLMEGFHLMSRFRTRVTLFDFLINAIRPGFIFGTFFPHVVIGFVVSIFK